MQRKHIIIAAVLIALAGAGLWWYFTSQKQPEPEDLAGETKPSIPK
jgi:hypothetical protein